MLVPAGLAIAGLFGACDRAVDGPTSDDPPDVSVSSAREVLVFPDALRVSDESVNTFVETAMRTCAAGEYDAFRRPDKRAR